MRHVSMRTRHWFLVTVVCIVIYIVTVQTIGLETVRSNVAVYPSGLLRMWESGWEWVNVAYSPTSTPLTRDYAKAQKECRSETSFVPHHVQLIANKSWIDGWSKELLDNTAVDVQINTTYTLSMKTPPYLENFKNPCWLEKLESADPYAGKWYRFQFSPPDFGVDPQFELRRKFKSRIDNGKGYRLRCLPYYFIIGPQKTGTTDLFEKMNYHPLLRRGRLKEPHFWPRSKNENNMTLSEYADLFDDAGDKIASTYVRCDGAKPNFYPLITGEGTAETMWDNWFWKNTPENKGLDEIKYLSAHHIRNVIPHARIIAILRNPIERLYSDFNYFGHQHPKTASSFHGFVEQAIHNMTDCIYHSENSRKTCIYNRIGAGRPVGSTWQPAVRLRMGLYSEFLEDWFDIFPKDQILLLNFDDYVVNRTMVLNQVFNFLGLEPFSPSLAKAIKGLSVDNSNTQNRAYSENILPQTEMMLKNFYRPFNEKLATISNNNDFLKWNYIT